MDASFFVLNETRVEAKKTGEGKFGAMSQQLRGQMRHGRTFFVLFGQNACYPGQCRGQRAHDSKCAAREWPSRYASAPDQQGKRIS
jgi:hypothetical protein